MGLQGLRFGINLTNIQAGDAETRMDVELEKRESHLSPIGVKRGEIESKVVDLGDRFTLIAKEGKVIGRNPAGEELELPRPILTQLFAVLEEKQIWNARKFFDALGDDKLLNPQPEGVTGSNGGRNGFGTVWF